MKYCQHCGTALLDAAVMCPNCGAMVGNYQATPGQTTMHQASAQQAPTPDYNAPAQAPMQQPPPNPQFYSAPPAPEAKKDKVSIGFCILAFLCPLFGIIYWAVVHRDTPKRGRACGITGIVSVVLKFVMFFFLIIIVAIFGSSYECETCFDEGYVECEECDGFGEYKNGSDCPYCVQGWQDCEDCDIAEN